MKLKKLLDERYLIIEELKEAGQTYMKESKASEIAKKMGLYHIGFGHYSKKQGGPIVYKTVDGNLVKYSGPKEPDKGPEFADAPEHDVSKTSELPGEPEKTAAPDNKLLGIQDIQKVQGKTDRPTYSFKYNGRPGVVVVTEKDEKEFDSVTAIIKGRIKAAEEKLLQTKAGIDPESEKEKEAEKEREADLYAKQKAKKQLQPKPEADPEPTPGPPQAKR